MHHPYHPDAIRAVTTPALFVAFPALRTDADLQAIDITLENKE